VVLVLLVVLLILFVVFPVIGLTVGALVSTILVGLIVGGLGRLVVPGRQRISLLATIFAGLIGAIVGGYIGDRVLYVGGLATALVEIGVSALVVAALSAPRNRRLSRIR
jgi:uncharacterized membrane protein YeaQ/YmgE (transglycosylase-associated protein family)